MALADSKYSESVWLIMSRKLVDCESYRKFKDISSGANMHDK